MAKERLFRRGKIWWCWYYDRDRRRVRETTTCSDKDAARAVLRRKEQEAQSGKTTRSYLALDDVLTDLEAFTKANKTPATLEIITNKSAHLRRVLGESTDVHALTMHDLEKYTHERMTKLPPRAEHARKPPVLPGRETVRKELGVLRQALNYAAKRGKFAGDVKALMPEFKAPYVPRKRWLTVKDFDALLEQLPEHRRLWVLIATFSGARKSEVEGLEWNDVHWSTRTIHIRGTKTAKSDRMVPLVPRLAKALEPGRKAKRKGALVEPWENVGRDLKVACEAIELDPVTPNDLRRTYASWLIQKGASSSIVASMLGHATTMLVDLTYGKVSQAAMQAAGALLPK